LDLIILPPKYNELKNDKKYTNEHEFVPCFFRVRTSGMTPSRLDVYLEQKYVRRTVISSHPRRLILLTLRLLHLSHTILRPRSLRLL